MTTANLLAALDGPPKGATPAELVAAVALPAEVGSDALDRLWFDRHVVIVGGRVLLHQVRLAAA